jgi:hypothetical protein
VFEVIDIERLPLKKSEVEMFKKTIHRPPAVTEVSVPTRPDLARWKARMDEQERIIEELNK